MKLATTARPAVYTPKPAVPPTVSFNRATTGQTVSRQFNDSASKTVHAPIAREKFYAAVSPPTRSANFNTKAFGQPANFGAEGRWSKTVLAPGMKLDRYGRPGGEFLARAGTPFDLRGLPTSARKSTLHGYEIIKPLPMRTSVIKPYPYKNKLTRNGARGTQYKSSQWNVEQLVRLGYLRKIKAPASRIAVKPMAPISR